MKLPFPLPYKTYGDFEKAERNARLFIEKHILDPYYGRKPLGLEEIKEKALSITAAKQTEAGIPISVLLATGADFLKDNPVELYNYYLTEIKPHLPNAPVPVYGDKVIIDQIISGGNIINYDPHS